MNDKKPQCFWYNATSLLHSLLQLQILYAKEWHVIITNKKGKNICLDLNINTKLHCWFLYYYVIV